MRNDDIPSYEELKKTGELIKEAVTLGILTDNEDHQYVYLNVQLPNGSVVWQPYSFLEATIDLVKSGNVELLENAVKEKKKEKNENVQRINTRGNA